MNTHRIYLGTGSNAEDAAERLAAALKKLCSLPGLSLAKASPVYRTEPQDYADQPWFHNQVLEFAGAAALEPVSLMHAFLRTEAELGRVRSPDPALRFGPRVIDIDMLLFDDVVSCDPVCVLPHPRLTVRAFWLKPLLDIAPDLVISGRPAAEHLASLSWHAEGDKIFQ